MTHSIPPIEEVFEAIRPEIVETPLLSSEKLNQLVGGRVFIKPEMLQKSGSFKYRGVAAAFSRLKIQNKGTLPRKILAWSSGNHGRAIAEAAKTAEIKAFIVMPRNAPDAKKEAIKEAGGKIFFYDSLAGECRETIGRAIAEKENAVIIPPYDHPDIIAGQASLGLEIARQMAEENIPPPDAIITPCGGGGLAAGLVCARAVSLKKCRIFGVEPTRFDDTKRSLSGNVAMSNKIGEKPSICDALLAPTPGKLTLAINRKGLEDIFVIGDSLTRQAVRIIFREFRLVAEPAGAIALASLLAHPKQFQNKTTIIIASGGNTDSENFVRAITG